MKFKHKTAMCAEPTKCWYFPQQIVSVQHVYFPSFAMLFLSMKHNERENT